MGFSSQQYRKEQSERKWKINPVWRGIGCFLLILIPIMSWYAAILLMDSGLNMINTQQFAKPLKVNYIKIVEIDRVINTFNQYTASHHLITGQFFYFVIFMFVGFGLLSVIYAILYRLLGPSRYGPFDIPPNSMRR